MLQGPSQKSMPAMHHAIWTSKLVEELPKKRLQEGEATPASVLLLRNTDECLLH